MVLLARESLTSVWRESKGRRDGEQSSCRDSLSKVQEEAATLSMVMGEECWEGQPERRVPKQRKREIHIRCSSQKTIGATLSPDPVLGR